ncbi:GDSL-like lipase/Acylhydrolase family protein [Hirsutella rhossiliensis]|uniref:GDSL-like lipase/Acylhydrolase family domain-containing protein n=1 Tax=Hirsutella rhossiliensis TaxID=111463 RepID=A0A9P8N221_9HYPO|nr:GDSL-like lipase/Acylhydrolase family domain-containing protein [Hirsutella rhossiliensis]KAH0966803.1 GDSL-like lipase/Acylhydrolase family domain-containing protein [Hirsutella rhossiliensis]
MAVPYPQVVLLGDSLLQRSVDLADGFSFQAALQTRCIRRLDIVNRGFSGWNTANAVQHLDDIIPEPSASSPVIKFLIVLFGANDAVIPLSTTSQHVPIEEYKRNLTRIITHPHVQAHKPTILLVTPPPIDEMKLERLDTADGHASAIRSFATSALYSEKAREVAGENAGVILIDLWQALMDAAIAMAPGDYQPGGPWLGSPENGKAGGLDHLLPDGLHMSGDAYRVLYEQVRPHIGEEWTNLPGRDRTGYLFPDWLELNTRT